MQKGKNRCEWVNLKNPLYIEYHDLEWGRPLHDDRALFELLILEGFQAGLSWECILNKRAAFRVAFDNFDIDAVASYDENKFGKLLNDPGIIRNRRKIQAASDNAIAFKEIQKEYGSFDVYIWHYTNGNVIYEDFRYATSSPLSDMISKDLKRYGMKFVGTTIIYSYLQAIGIINAHSGDCYLHNCEK